MAKVYPDGWREVEASGAAGREIQTLHRLAAGLDDRYSVYHGVHWTRVQGNNFAIVGEVDFAILGPTGKLLLIEQKTGILTETPTGLVKKFADKHKDVAIHLARTAEALRERLRKSCETESIELDTLLYCPDYTVREPGSAGIDPARIVDAKRRDELHAVIRAILPPDGESVGPRTRIHRFLCDILQLVPEVHAIVGEAGALSTRLSGGLAHWARRIEFSPFRLRVIGTAGSGKTQLAMAVYREAIAAGRHPLYVCYNRPLADHISRIVPAGGEVLTYHQLGDRISRALGQTPDFTQPGAFAKLEATLDGHTPADSERCDDLIVDEGQDFREGWAVNLMRWLRPEGRAWWLEDPMQNLYGRPTVNLPDWVTLRSDVNYRTPKDIVVALNRMLPLPREMEAGSPLTGGEIDIMTYSDAIDLVAKTASAITRCIGLGFKRPHIALVTYRGREHSKLASLDRLGTYPLRASTGRYDLFGNALYTEGDILIDSVLRFKGRASPCVVFTEIDFESLDDAAVRRLFVGATRASMKLVLVASERAVAALQQGRPVAGLPDPAVRTRV
jgi:hypothetical protein